MELIFFKLVHLRVRCQNMQIIKRKNTFSFNAYYSITSFDISIKPQKIKKKHHILHYSYNSLFSNMHILALVSRCDYHHCQLESCVLSFPMYSEHIYKVGFWAETTGRMSCAIFRCNTNTSRHRGTKQLC